MSVNKVLLIRHGETDYNVARRLQGRLPIPLNTNGQSQAQALGLYLQGKRLDAIYASPMPRAKKTADIISACTNIPVQVDERIREISFGIFEGLTFTEIETQHAEAYRMWKSGDMNYVVPDGESRRAVQHRMVDAWTDVTIHNGTGTIALVSHGTSLKLLLRYLLYYIPDMSIANTSLTTLARYNIVWEIETFAETQHLNDKST